MPASERKTKQKIVYATVLVRNGKIKYAPNLASFPFLQLAFSIIHRSGKRAGPGNEVTPSLNNIQFVCRGR